MTITSVNEAITNFDKIVREYSPKGVGEAEKIVGEIRRARQIMPRGFNNKDIAKFLRSRNKTVKELCDQLLMARLSSLYGAISPDLFQLKRHISVVNGKVQKDACKKTSSKKKDKELRFQIPLFVYTELGIKTIEVGNTTTSKTVTRTVRVPTRYEYDYSRHETVRTQERTKHTLTVKVPKLPDDVNVDRIKARGAYYRIIGDFLMDDTLAEIFADTKFGEPEFGVTWIPTADSFNYKATKEVQKQVPKHIDPALYMTVDQRDYLIRTWDIKDEEPFDHFLREFTEGKYPCRDVTPSRQ